MDMDFELEKQIYHEEFWMVFFNGFPILMLDGKWCQAIFENTFENQRARIAFFERAMDIREYAGFDISMEDAIKIQYAFSTYKQAFDEQLIRE